MINKIKKLFKKEDEEPKTVRMRWFYIDKDYHEMTRREKREYKRWLAKNNRWDGAVVIENHERTNKDFLRGYI